MLAEAPQMLQLLRGVLAVIDGPEAEWWMDCPSRGGFDAVAIRESVSRIDSQCAV